MCSTGLMSWVTKTTGVPALLAARVEQVDDDRAGGRGRARAAARRRGAAPGRRRAPARRAAAAARRPRAGRRGVARTRPRRPRRARASTRASILASGGARSPSGGRRARAGRGRGRAGRRRGRRRAAAGRSRSGGSARAAGSPRPRRGPALGCEQPEQDAEQRRLAGAVRAEDGEQLAPLELEARDRLEERALAEAQRELVDGDERSSRERGRERAGLGELPLLEA